MDRSPTSRLLELLELLQTRPLVTGREVADRFAIDRRTVRRDVETLQHLGIPVEGERGVGGGYRLRPGYRMPPLMLTEGETTAVVLALTSARRFGLGLGDPADTAGALAKIHRVLPESLRRRAQALESALAFTAPQKAGETPAGETALVLAEAIRRQRRVHARYRSHQGEQTERQLSPYGLVVHHGRWYLAAHDHKRAALRTFRVDRIHDVTIGDTATAPPDDFDPVEHVSRSLAQTPWRWEVEALLELPIDQARARVPATLAELTQEQDTTALRTRVDSLQWAALLLAGLDCPFHVRRPDELRIEVNNLGRHLTECANA